MAIKQTTYGQNIAVAIMACMAIVLLPLEAYAGPMQDAICFIVIIIWGDLGTGIAILGICAASAAAMLGKASWGMAMTVAAGVAIMFGASQIADLLGVGFESGQIQYCPDDT